jgi:hypothetical protein
MRNTSEYTTKLQAPQSSKKLPRIEYEFVPVPAMDTLPRYLHAYMKTLIWLWRKGWLNPAYRWLATKMKVARETIRRWNRKLEELGFLKTERGSHTHDTNVFTLIGFGPPGGKKVPHTDVGEIQERVLKTTTPAPPAAVSSATAELHKARKAHDATVSVLKRKIHEITGEKWSLWKLVKRQARPDANVGVNPDKTPNRAEDLQWVNNWRAKQVPPLPAFTLIEWMSR